MRSIRHDLALRIGGASLLILLAGGLGLYLSLRKALETQFDKALATKAQALVTASEIDDGQFEIDLDVQAFAGFGSRAPGDYFEVFAADGSPVQRSPSLGTADLALPEDFARIESGFADIVLPDGYPGRAFWKTFVPAIDEDEDLAEGEEVDLPAVPVAAPELRILVASDDSAHHRTLRTVALFIALFGSGGVFLTVAILHSVVRSGLKPLELLSADVQRIDVQHLAQRLPVGGLPTELQGVAAKLNELLERLEVSFAREKRFTSDAAHELRTPLAELRAMTELGARWPEEFTADHGREMLAVLDELGRLLDTLSLLARAEGGSVPGFEAVDLVSGLEESVARCRDEASARRLTFDLSVEDGPFRCDPVLWRTIVGNLVGNAVAYAPEGGEIRVEASPRHLAVENEAPDLDESDLSHLFERFWRKSASRTAKEHSGLGLSVVRAAVESLGGDCRATLRGGRLRIEVLWSGRGNSDELPEAARVSGI